MRLNVAGEKQKHLQGLAPVHLQQSMHAYKQNTREKEKVLPANREAVRLTDAMRRAEKGKSGQQRSG